MDFKNIHIGKLIHKKFKEKDFSIERSCNFLKCTEKEITNMFEQEDLETSILLKWSKLLKYDFFRIYSHHLILYAPPQKIEFSSKYNSKSTLPSFRKNLYTKEIIDFIVELIDTEQKTKLQIMSEYKIPKTTLHKWIEKYGNKK
ncbi:transposase [Chryseobacterium lathyri]|jgi:hypothetical protein|uniref:Uncharacterized protein n=1 Tax=Chryseobacterium lathyri TaxID=395933 RepID=A0A511YDT6_9FLAO|nr:transposase [Chryseobacterium lathyri]GEN73351.1 hypothetical protein CLA01_34230 [Chryseobacterium lathyri]